MHRSFGSLKWLVYLELGQIKRIAQVHFSYFALNRNSTLRGLVQNPINLLTRVQNKQL